MRCSVLLIFFSTVGFVVDFELLSADDAVSLEICDEIKTSLVSFEAGHQFANLEPIMLSMHLRHLLFLWLFAV